jgi:hypothetical protein
MSTINAVPFRSTIFYTAAGVPAATGSVLTIGDNGLSGFTKNLGSTMVSIGASTNQTYNNFSGGSFTTGWASTLTGLSAITDIIMTPNGQYQLAVQNGSSTIRTSANSGVTWGTLTSANGLPAGATAYPQATAAGTPNYTTVSASATGQYQLASVSGGLLYVTANGTSASPTFTAVGMGSPFIYLPFEGSSYADVLNATSGSNVGIGTGSAPLYTTGIVGSGAVNLFNTAGSTATRYLRGTWSGSSACTISFWFNPQTISSVYQYIFSMYSGAIQIFISNANTINCAFPTGTTTGQTVISTPYAASVNTWYNIAAVFQTNGICSLYVNNVLIGTMTNGSGGYGTFTQNNVFSLGTYDNAFTNCFNGYIDDFRIYNTSVTYSPISPANWTQTAVSATGQYMLAAANGGGLFLSSNYGATWTQVNAVLNGGGWNSLSMSASGQYALATTSAATVSPTLASLAAYTWSVNGVTWAVSASSVYLNPPYYLFNTATDNWASSISTYNASGVYTGSVSTTVLGGVGAVTGEWFQIQSSVPLVASSFSYIPFNMACTAKTYYLLGSNDGTTWYAIQAGSYGTTNPCTNGTTQTSTIIINSASVQTVIAGAVGSLTTTTYATTTAAYTYFRLVGTAIWSSAPAAFLQYGEFYINFVGGLAYTTNYGQTWTNAANSLFNDSAVISGSGQYTIGVNNQLLPYAYLPMEGNQNDSRGVLTNATNGTGSGAVTFPGNQYKVGTNAAYITNTAGATTSLSYLNYTVPAALYQPTALTMACWVYISALPASNIAVPIGFNGGGASIFGTNIGIRTTGFATVQIYTGVNNYYIEGTSAISINTWTHLVFTYANSLGSLYVNGVLQSTLSGNATLNAVNAGSIANVTNLFIGCDATNWGGFAGYVDDVRIYTSALTATAIAELYAVPALNPIPLAYLGSNYFTGLNGSSYSPIVLSNINANINCASSSQTGQYMVILTQGTSNNVYYSINYGTSWTALTVGSAAMTSCAISADGSYITVSNATTVYTLNRNTQGFTVAVGNQAGLTNQAQNAIAIGNQAGQTNQTANSIILNASGSAVNPYTQGFYVTPIAQAFQSSALTFPVVGYGSDNQIVQAAHSFSNSQSVVYGEWIQYQLATASPITSYTLQGRGTLMNRYPVSWVIVGSNDATTWTLLDTQTGTSGWGTYTLKAVGAAYTYYRMVITQMSSVNLGYIDIAGWSLINGTPLFGASANYTVLASGLYNVLQYNGAAVCTTTFSWANTAIPNSLGIASDNTFGSTYQPGWIPTLDGYRYAPYYYYVGFYITAYGATYEYNSSYIAVQGTSTTITTTTLGDMNMSGAFVLSSNSRVGIGSTNPQYALDVLGTAQLNGVVPAFGQPDSSALPQNAYATFAQTWNQLSVLSNGYNWYGCGLSATGQYQTAIVNGSNSGNNIYYSSNYGQSWALATGFLANAAYVWMGMSGSGQYQLTSINTTSSALYVSSNYGQTWSATSYTMSASATGRCSCISYNGQYQFNVQAGGSIAVSSNYGASFANASVSTGSWNAVCCSWSGQYVSAAIYGGNIYYSTNYGVTWTACSGLSNASWNHMCCSASGQYQMITIATGGSGGIWYSNNYGMNWSQSNASNSPWQSISCTSTGQYAIASIPGGYIYYSTNYGVTWAQSGSPSVTWQFCSLSQNGVYALACASGTNALYTSQLTNVGLLTNGRVGVGMTNPATSLHVYQSLGATSFYNTFGTASAMPAQLILESPNTHRLYLGSYYTGGAGELAVIQSSSYYSSTDHIGTLLLNPNGGPIGIGSTTANGTTALDVNGIARAITGFGTNSGSVSGLTTTGTVIHTFRGGLSFLTAIGSNNFTYVGLFSYIGNVTSFVGNNIVTNGLTATIDGGLGTITLKTVSGTSNVAWNITYLACPSYSGPGTFTPGF